MGWRAGVGNPRKPEGLWSGSLEGDFKGDGLVLEQHEVQGGEGNKVMFWTDHWCGNEALSQAFPQIFALAACRNAAVDEVWDPRLGQGGWNLSLVRDSNDWELGLIEDLLFLLRDIRVTPEEDSVLWKGGDSDSFRIRGLIICWQPLILLFFPEKIFGWIWSHPKWLSLRGRLLGKKFSLWIGCKCMGGSFQIVAFCVVGRGVLFTSRLLGVDSGPLRAGEVFLLLLLWPWGCLRVKVYRLNDDGKWDDQGTGHVSVDYMERTEELGLFVIDEEDHETLLLHRISSEDIYRKQEETIISWRDPEYSTELALSFQETTGCSFIWDHICTVQRNLQFNNLSNLGAGSFLVNETMDASGATQSNPCNIGVKQKKKKCRGEKGGGGSCVGLQFFGPGLTIGGVMESFKEGLAGVPCLDFPWQWEMGGELRLEMEKVTHFTASTIVLESGIAEQIRLTELILNDQEFFQKLMDLFRICEDLENMDGLHMIYKIVKGIILLNSPQIFEKLFGDDLIMDVIGSLEYDPDILHAQHHRNFLKEHVVFKEAIPIKDPMVLSKIHQTYRVGYLKDVVLPRVLDEATVANLNSIIHSNNAVEDSTFIQELFVRLRLSSTSAESKKNLVFFLYEFCSLSKSLQMVQQLRLFRDLVNEGIFDIVSDALQSQDKRLVLTGTDILILFLNQDPNLLRSYVIRQEGIPLLGLLVKGMITDFGEDMNCQFLEILRSLLDSYTLSGSQRDTIIEIFYEKHLGQLIDVITSSCPKEGGAQSISKSAGPDGKVENQITTKPEILSNICELLCFCVLHHPYRIKCNFLLNNVIDKVLFLTRRREKYLVVAAVRFVRTIFPAMYNEMASVRTNRDLNCTQLADVIPVPTRDEHLINHVIKNNLLKPVVDVFVANGNRYNLLNSAVLELFEYIRRDNLKPLLKYLYDSFWDQLVKFQDLACIKTLKVKYEQTLEDCVAKGTINAVDSSRKRIDERALEKEEEDYFNEDSDEEDTASACVSHTNKVQAQPVLSNGVAANYPSLSPRSGGLVDYADDEDEEEYRPPPKKQPENPDGDEGALESLKLKRKLASKEKEPEPAKKARLAKNPKSKDGVFAALCSTLSQAVLPNKKIASPIHITPRTTDGNQSTDEEKHQEDEPLSFRSCSDNSSSSDEENHREKEPAASRNCSDCLHSSSDNRQLGGEDCPLIPPKSSPEMAVNGA
ncbi:Serine/threonine-protein phosphatase 4 regulatory subunit 3 [Vitis vinifera]|uniref:Serine/threonine-protein phosphatase 4 regulatory subunit 3 n=1 Tax=Vitis vinifera TaxID=29760 RepID=A0A438IQU3_VITVI|nr:Serine/threonine-protein phosphatase 4 regulatory subunit 3 [Vitis vinifera]